VSVLGKLLGLDWLARKLGYVEQDVRIMRRDLTDTTLRLEKLEQIVCDLLLGDAPAKGLDARMRKFLGAPFDASDHFKVDPTCPIGQLHEVGEKQWAVHPRTLADIEAKRLESVQLHTYDKPRRRWGDAEMMLGPPEPRPEPLRVPVADPMPMSSAVLAELQQRTHAAQGGRHVYSDTLLGATAAREQAACAHCTGRDPTRGCTCSYGDVS
jgi:hypothetical protein